MGYWVLTRSGLSAIAVEEQELHGLLKQSIGVLPSKVRAGEAHSVFMDFNVSAASEETITSADNTISEADSQRPYYEIELQAAGATVDGEKQCAIFDSPTTYKRIWNCSFPNAGIQVLHLLFNEVRPVHRQNAAHALVREPLLTFVHNIRVGGRFTASPDNAVSMIGVIVTVVSVLVTLRV